MPHEMESPAAILESCLGGFGYGTPIYCPSDVPDGGIVAIGDVGYISNGCFYRAFNAAHPSTHMINSLGLPPNYEARELRDQDIEVTYMKAGTVFKRGFREQKPKEPNEDDDPIKTHSFSLRHWSVVGFARGAFMYFSEKSKVAKLTDAAMDEWKAHFRANHKAWLDWSSQVLVRTIPPDDLILVTSCVLTPKWVIAIAEGSGQFSIQYRMDMDAEARILEQSGNVDVECFAGYGNPDLSQIPGEEMEDYFNGLRIVPRVPSQCVFLTGLNLSKAKSTTRHS